MSKVLTKMEMVKYQRHFAIEEFTEEHQLKIKNAKVLIVGAGGLGSPLSIYLAAAGVGTIGIIDDDVVSLTNLQRQVLYSHTEIGEKKVKIAKEKLAAVNPEVEIITHDARLTVENNNIISDYDLVVDGSDNFEARYCIDNYCCENKIPYVYGSIFETTGQVSVFNYLDAGSYNDLYPKEFSEDDSGQMIGVIGFMPGVIANIQVGEVIKIITGLGEPLVNKLLTIDLFSNRYKIIKI